MTNWRYEVYAATACWLQRNEATDPVGRDFWTRVNRNIVSIAQKRIDGVAIDRKRREIFLIEFKRTSDAMEASSRRGATAFLYVQKTVDNKPKNKEHQNIAQETHLKSLVLCLLLALFCLPSKDLSDNVSIKNSPAMSISSSRGWDGFRPRGWLISRTPPVLSALSVGR